MAKGVAIYRYRPAEGCEWVVPETDADLSAIQRIHDVSSEAEWSAPNVRIVREDEGVHFRRSDFPWFASSVPVLREAAWKELHDLLAGFAEPRPLVCEGAHLVALRVNAATPLDDADSVVRRFRSGRVLELVSASFNPKLVTIAPMFRAEGIEGGPVFLSEPFLARVAERDLKGLDPAQE